MLMQKLCTTVHARVNRHADSSWARSDASSRDAKVRACIAVRRPLHEAVLWPTPSGTGGYADCWHAVPSAQWAEVGAGRQQRQVP